MADSTREMSQEYWRPAIKAGDQFAAHSFQLHGQQEFCATCGTPYATGARFCHLCGIAREDDLRAKLRVSLASWLELEKIREQTGLSIASLVLVLAAALCVIATVLAGLVSKTVTVEDWQALQTCRIEWLLAALVALVAAVLFKAKS